MINVDSHNPECDCLLCVAPKPKMGRPPYRDAPRVPILLRLEPERAEEFRRRCIAAGMSHADYFDGMLDLTS